MEYKSFEDYLEFCCFKENPMILDDNMPDFFDNWIANLDVSEVIIYADEYANKIKSDIRIEVLNITN